MKLWMILFQSAMRLYLSPPVGKVHGYVQGRRK